MFNAGGKSKTKAYIIRNDDNSRMDFQYNPTTMPYSRGVSYASIESPGMSYPLTQYAGGGAREFSFELFYYDRPYTGAINSARQFLEKLMPPEYNTNDFDKPPSFTLAYGYFVKRCVLMQLDVEDEMLDEEGQPLITRFTLTVRQVGR